MNWIAILVAAASTWAIGAIWYNPKVMGKLWMAETGMTEEKAKEGNMPLIFGLGFVFAVLLAIFLSYSVSHDDATFKHGAFHGLLASILVALPVLFTNALYEQKSWKYMFVNWGYWVLCFVIMGGILCVWR